MLAPLFSRNPSLLFLPAVVRIARGAMSASPAAKATVSVEYAKSGRSSCKGCSAAIAKGALRLGASARDPRGYDSTKWYHVACFPASSHPLGPVEEVQGFDSIKDDDREELRELEKNNKSDQTAVSPLEVPSPKKAKVSPKAEVAEKGSVSVEYAKSARSTCKACNASIAKGALRIGVSAHDPRGFDSTKWYHVACFPASSHLLGPVEEVQGFDSIKDDDREELQELEKNNKRDQTAVSPLEVPSPKKAKVLPKAEVAEKGSVSVEYAKSARSTCKACNASITKGALRIGVSAHDPRGFDSTKWYHVACFPTSSHPLGRVEKLKGFDSIKDDDREELRELEKNKKGDQAAVGPVELSSPNKGNSHISLPEVEVAEKSSPGNKTVGTAIPFSPSDIKKTYKDATLPTHWKAFDTVIFREQDDGLHASAKIAAFDFDGCLAKTSVKIIGADKWSLQHKSIPDKLQSLYNDGYKLVIFTNESNIERWKNKRQRAVDSKVGRLDNFIECVKVPIQVFIACGTGKGKGTPDDLFRKPNSGMWWLMAEHFNSGIAIDMDQSFYVGDAAGRENDHSDADIEFAKAIGLKFHVPEEFFGP
ncbi:polynucleotide 3'-phosphatase ZDP [Aegilops tauschii subsp. strangulata]|uniref:PARP-type domain-containing protein n=5 Tax=Triticinae TaxID=1648030 RepID=A0A453FG54_AEGTS|nr:polynucleotide 3'-phosphatase ZDP [Aegilops tauschii subsp. strangulata]XP_044357700.1 polynucleotide 3'-phosphatase ZDP-like [Triticum aestivum]